MPNTFLDGFDHHELGVPHPWVGPNYGVNPVGLRLMVLGESHNDEVSATTTLGTTIRVMRHYLGQADHPDDVRKKSSPNYMQFFSRLEQMILGPSPKPTIAEAVSLWNGVVFANYCPRQVVGLRTSPKADDWAGARPRFAELVRYLKPNLICFFTAAGWNNRPRAHEGSWAKVFSQNPVEMSEDRLILPYDGRQALAVKFAHPTGIRNNLAHYHRVFAHAAVDALKLKYGLTPFSCLPAEVSVGRAERATQWGRKGQDKEFDEADFEDPGQK